MIFLTKGYHVFCFFHISWQDVGGGKAFGHPGIPRQFPVGVLVPNDRTQQVARLILCSRQQPELPCWNGI